MKIIQSISIVLVTLLLTVGCDKSNTMPTSVDGIGTFTLSLASSEIQSEVITRTALNIDAATFQITLAEKDGTVLFENKPFGTLTETEYTLPAATNYQLKAENCTLEESVELNDGWGMPHFVGNTTFNIVSNQHTPVSLICTMNNVGIQVVFSQDFLDKFPIHAVTTQDSRAIVFNQDTQEEVAYYPAEGDNITVSIKLTGSAGGWTDRLDTTKELVLSKGKLYTLYVTYKNNRLQCKAVH